MRWEQQPSGNHGLAQIQSLSSPTRLALKDLTHKKAASNALCCYPRPRNGCCVPVQATALLQTLSGLSLSRRHRAPPPLPLRRPCAAGTPWRLHLDTMPRTGESAAFRRSLRGLFRQLSEQRLLPPPSHPGRKRCRLYPQPCSSSGMRASRARVLGTVNCQCPRL